MCSVYLGNNELSMSWEVYKHIEFEKVYEHFDLV